MRETAKRPKWIRSQNTLRIYLATHGLSSSKRVRASLIFDRNRKTWTVDVVAESGIFEMTQVFEARGLPKEAARIVMMTVEQRSMDFRNSLYEISDRELLKAYKRLAFCALRRIVRSSTVNLDIVSLQGQTWGVVGEGAMFVTVVNCSRLYKEQGPVGLSLYLALKGLAGGLKRAASCLRDGEPVSSLCDSSFDSSEGHRRLCEYWG